MPPVDAHAPPAVPDMPQPTTTATPPATATTTTTAIGTTTSVPARTTENKDIAPRPAESAGKRSQQQRRSRKTQPEPTTSTRQRTTIAAAPPPPSSPPRTCGPAFPGARVTRQEPSSSTGQIRPRRQPPPSATSAAPTTTDLRTSLQRSLTKEDYDCMVCWDVVRRRQKTWSCDRCWNVFHLDCITSWASRSSSESLSAHWRCPTCQLERSSVPTQYLCFCGRDRDPVVDRFLTPHSCGEPCGKALCRQNPSAEIPSSGYVCPHRCTLPCHPGPCPPCNALASADVNQCYCGRKKFSLRCKDLMVEPSEDGAQSSATVRSCGSICNRMLECQRHRCEKPCHYGPCSYCSEVLVETCFCKKHHRDRPCAEVSPNETTLDRGYSCKELCEALLACGNHRCEKKCHPADGGKHHQSCPVDPSVLTNCPCGKVPMDELSSKNGLSPRTTCSDLVWTCGKPCKKTIAMPCGHVMQCKALCHFGPCESQQSVVCNVTSMLPCRCGNEKVSVSCRDRVQTEDDLGVIKMELPACSKLCQVLRSCGRHRCHKRCCSGTEESHTCTLPCGKGLKCGNHSCTKSCHRGPCPPCLEANFNEYRCHCRKTFLVCSLVLRTVLSSPSCIDSADSLWNENAHVSLSLHS